MRRVKRWTVVSLSVIVAAVALSLLYAQQGGASASPALRIPFDEKELARYRVDIRPATPDSGIMTGFVVAYGHFLAPPYQVTAMGESIYVNSVRVDPPLGPKPRAMDSGAVQAFEQSRAGTILSRLRVVAERGVQFYERALLDGADTAYALAAAESLMKTDSLVLRVAAFPASRYRRVLYGPVAARPSGREREVRYDMLFPRERPVRHVSPTTRDSLLQLRVASLQASLRRGSGRVYAGGVTHSASVLLALRLANVMLEPALRDSDRWKRLMDFCSPTVAYFCVANQDQSRSSWRSFAETCGGGE